MKKLLIILGLVIIACIPELEPGDIIEEIGVAGKTQVDLINGDDTTLLYESNSVHDSLINKFMQWTANGQASESSGGAEYFWVWHTKDGTYYWSQVGTSDESGGGDTAANLVQVGTYIAATGITYDSTIQYRWIASGYILDGSVTDTGYVDLHWCEQKADTFVLGSAGELEITWTLALTGSAAILDTFLWHLARGFQSGYCDKCMDTLRLIWTATVDTNTLVPSKSFDYTNDTLTFTVTDTPRSAADTVDKIIGLDDDGDWVYYKDVSLHIGQDTTPQIKVKIVYAETP